MANPYFNAAYYLANNQDLVLAGVTEETAELHYDLHGAGEGRAPNSWFDAQAYLLANTDLVPGGVTLSTALLHFATHGVYEGRIFNNNPALAPSNFDAAGYAEANADVAEALEIEDPENPTAEEAALLLSHFLAHGLVEGRTGAGDAFEEAAQTPAIEVDPTEDDVTVGTAGNDTFTWVVDAAANKASINGLAGNDTLKISGTAGGATVTAASLENIQLNAAGNLTVLGAGVEKVTFGETATGTYAGEKVDSVVLNGTGAVTMAFNKGVNGTADALAVATGAATANLTVNGIEQLNVALTDKAAGTTVLNANAVNGGDLTFNVSGGKAGTNVTLDIDSVGSAKLSTVTVNAADVVGNATIDLGGSSLVNVDAVVTGGAGNDNITTDTAAGLEATVNAGAGNDTINGSAGIDNFTGGAGADTFAFTANSAVMVLGEEGDDAGEVLGFDSITDFKATKGDTVNETVTLAFTALTDGPLTGIGSVEGGVVSFQTGFLGNDTTITDVVSALDVVMGAGQGVVFDFDGDAYLFVSRDAAAPTSDLTTDNLIQLVGVDVDALAVSDGVIAFDSYTA